MKIARITFFVATLAFLAGFWAACSIGFDETEGQFSCTVDQDCIAPFRCLGGVCKKTGDSTCEDKDGDGFGVGEEELRRDCTACQERGQCEEDCNDNDESIAPGLLDTCDGKDNNCDEQIDEPIPCESSIDCPDESPYLPSCNANQECEYKPPLQVGAECNMPAACVMGERSAPDQCF